MVPRRLRGTRHPLPHFHPVGRAHRIPQPAQNTARSREGGGRGGQNQPRTPGGFRIPRRQRNPQPHGALAGSGPCHRIRRASHLPGQTRRSRRALFLRELPADRIPAPAERGLFHLQRLPAPAGRFRPLPRAFAEPRGGPAARPRRVRHGHHPPQRGRAGGNAVVAYRERGARRAGRDDHLRVDRRVVPRRPGNPRLGFWSGHARAGNPRRPTPR